MPARRNCTVVRLTFPPPPTPRPALHYSYAVSNRCWVKVTPAEGRAQQLEVTAAGRAFMKKIAPAWKKAQKQLFTLLGPDLAQGLFDAADKLRAADSEK